MIKKNKEGDLILIELERKEDLKKKIFIKVKGRSND